MRNKLALFISVLIIFMSFPSLAQVENYKYKREILNISEDWHKIELPTDIFTKVKPGLEDFRIIGITKENDTIKTPHLIEVAHEETNISQVSSNLSRRKSKKDTYYYIFKLANTQPINQIDLSFNDNNFERLVILEGSDNLRKWTQILDNYRVISFSNEYFTYSFSSLIFDQVDYKYYRVSFGSENNPGYIKASMSNKSFKKIARNSYKPKNSILVEKEDTKSTIQTIILKNTVPLNHINIKVKNNYDYYRPIEIVYAHDSIKTKEGWDVRYRTLYNGILSSLEDFDLWFNPIFTNKIVVEIKNYDNQPLSFSNITFEGPKVFLTARFDAKASYYLFYGNKKAKKAQYDISIFKDNIPENTKNLELGKEEIRIYSTDDELTTKSKTNHLSSKNWLWIIMAIIVISLGSLTIVMIRNINSSKQ